MMFAFVIGTTAPAAVTMDELSAQSRRVACLARPGRAGWSWRQINGRRCWFEGRRSIPKTRLYWPPAATPSPSRPILDVPLPIPRPVDPTVPAQAGSAFAYAAPLYANIAEIFARVPTERPLLEPEPPEPLDEPLPVYYVKTVRWLPPPPPLKPGPAWLTTALLSLGLASLLVILAAASPGAAARGRG